MDRGGGRGRVVGGGGGGERGGGGGRGRHLLEINTCHMEQNGRPQHTTCTTHTGLQLV